MARGRGRTPILLVPYMWIGDFVRCHTVVRLLNRRFPGRPVDVLDHAAWCPPWPTTCRACARAIVADLPRKRLALGRASGAGAAAAAEGYGDALVMPRTWKSALAPFLAGIGRRTGFFGEARFGLLNDLRWGERALPRMIDRCAALAMPNGESAPAELPHPQLEVPAERGRELAAAQRHRRRSPPRGGAGAGRGRAVEAMDDLRLRRAGAAPHRRRACRSGSWAAPARRRSPPRSPAPIRRTRAT